MRIIHKKIKECFADAILNGEKTFEVRKNEEGYQKGDIIRFKVVDDSMWDFTINHPLNDKSYEITYVISGWGIEPGYVVFSIKEKVEDNEE